jgi:hypothetical protein
MIRLSIISPTLNVLMGYHRSRCPFPLSRNMNNLYDALDHIEKTIFLLGEDLVTLTVGQGLVSLPAVALAEELLKPMMS